MKQYELRANWWRPRAVFVILFLGGAWWFLTDDSLTAFEVEIPDQLARAMGVGYIAGAAYLVGFVLRLATRGRAGAELDSDGIRVGTLLRERVVRWSELVSVQKVWLRSAKRFDVVLVSTQGEVKIDCSLLEASADEVVAGITGAWTSRL